MEWFLTFILGFFVGAGSFYLAVYLPTNRLNEGYQERLRQQLKRK